MTTETKQKSKPNVTIGQTLFMLNIGNAARNREHVLTEVTVSKVGRKYFTVTIDGRSYFDLSFHIDTWSQKTEYSQDYCLYETKQEWEDEKESLKLYNKIKSSFNYSNNIKNLPLTSLKEIVSIINRDTKYVKNNE